MRKARPWIAGLMLLVVGGAIGWFAARYSNPTKPSGTVDLSNLPDGPSLGIVKPDYRYRAGNQDLFAVPSWEEWKYPSSRVHKSGHAGERFIGKIKGGKVDRVSLVSADDFDKVWAFYTEKVMQKIPDRSRPMTTYRAEGEGRDKVTTVTIFDTAYACSIAGPPSDLLQAKGLWVQSLRYNLSAFVYRSKGSDSTGILLLHRVNDDFMGLLKEKLAKE